MIDQGVLIIKRKGVGRDERIITQKDQGHENGMTCTHTCSEKMSQLKGGRTKKRGNRTE